MRSCISSQEFGGGPTAAVPDHRLSRRQTAPRKWVEGLHNEGFRRTPHVLFPSHIGCIYYSNPPRFRLLSSAGIDRPVSGKKKNGRGWISFFPPSDGASDQYSHCWLSFGNLYNGVSHRSIARNCLHFQIKRSFFRFSVNDIRDCSRKGRQTGSLA